MGEPARKLPTGGSRTGHRVPDEEPSGISVLQRWVEGADGRMELLELPLTPELFLDPQPGDKFLQGTRHFRAIFSLYELISRAAQRDRTGGGSEGGRGESCGRKRNWRGSAPRSNGSRAEKITARGLAGRKDAVTWFPRASAFGLGPALGSAGPPGRIFCWSGPGKFERVQAVQAGPEKFWVVPETLEPFQEAQTLSKDSGTGPEVFGRSRKFLDRSKIFWTGAWDFGPSPKISGRSKKFWTDPKSFGRAGKFQDGPKTSAPDLKNSGRVQKVLARREKFGADL